MLTFLSDEWIAALHEAASSDVDLAERTRDLSLTIEQEITGGPDGDVRYGMRFDHGAVSVTTGAVPGATVRFHQDYTTAASIAMGQGSAQRAFMTGRLRVGGDLRVLLAHGDVLAQIEDVFAPVRARTAPPVPSTTAADGLDGSTGSGESGEPLRSAPSGEPGEPGEPAEPAEPAEPGG